MESTTDHPVRKRGDRLLRVLPWEVQMNFSTAVDQKDVLGDKGGEETLKFMNMKACIEEGEEKKKPRSL